MDKVLLITVALVPLVFKPPPEWLEVDAVLVECKVALV
jgi:hypothetical protein